MEKAFAEQNKRADFLKSAAFLAMPGIPLLVTLGIKLGMPWLSFVVVYILVPLLDLFIGRDPTNPYVEGASVKTTSTAYFYAIPHAYMLVWLATLLYTIYQVSVTDMSTVDLIWVTLALGNASSFATCAAHELQHRPGRLDYYAARVIMALCWYGHFIIEHLHHHATAGHVPSGTVPQRGETIYHFVWRNVLLSIRNTIRLENQRLRRRALPVWQHRVLQQYVLTLAASAAVFLIWGLAGLIVYVAQALYAAFAVEMIQYLEHYGLTRSADEPVTAKHSWNNDLFITNAITLNITRHSDHHLNIRIPYQHLRAHPRGPSFPAGYFALAWLAVIPPLWFRVVDKHIEREFAAKMWSSEPASTQSFFE